MALAKVSFEQSQVSIERDWSPTITLTTWLTCLLPLSVYVCSNLFKSAMVGHV